MSRKQWTSHQQWAMRLVVLACPVSLLSGARGEQTQVDQKTSLTASAEASGIDPATVEKLSPELATRLTSTAEKVMSLPRLRDLSVDAARELATHRVKQGEQTFTVNVYVIEERTVTYTVMVPYSEEKTLDDGKKVTESKCRPEQRTRTFTVTKCVPETKTRIISLPNVLQLDALASPPPSVLAELAKHKGDLRLSGMKKLSPEQAVCLAAHKGGALVLDGLKSLSAEAAERIAGHEGGLQLNGLDSMTVDVAKALAAHKSELSLDGIKVMTGEEAVALVSHSGAVSLMGVKKLSPKATQVFEVGHIALAPEQLPPQRKMALVNTLFNERKFAEAEPLAKQLVAVREREKKSNPAAMESSLVQLGAIYQEQKKYDAAESAYVRALQVRSASQGAESVEAAAVVKRLACLRADQGNHAEAERLFRESLVIHERVFGSDHPEVADIHQRLAHSCEMQEK